MGIDRTAPPEPASILIVDDTRANLDLLSTMLRTCGYDVRPVPSGRLAMAAAAGDPPDLILLDISMPGMDGFEVCALLKADSRLRAIPVVFVSALVDVEEKVRAFRAGGVDYITKPFQFEEVKVRVETQLRLAMLQKDLEREVDRKVAEISEAQMTLIFSLARMTELRDNETGRHLERVQTFCDLLTSALEGRPGYEEVTPEYRRLLIQASPLHDIGKVGIPDAILTKPGALTPEEFGTMKRHALIGARHLEELLQRYPGNTFIRMGIGVARSHHEWWDGSGYPDGLSGGAIPLCARIVALADVYDALRSRRIYKEPFDQVRSLAIVAAESGRHFDPALAAILLERGPEFDRAFDELTDEPAD